MSKLRLLPLAAILAIAMLGGTATTAPAAVPEHYYGLSAPELLRLSDRGETERLERHLSAIERTGVKTIRVNLSWADYDGFFQQGFFPLRDLDRFVTALANHGLTMLPVPRGAPPRTRDSNLVECLDGDRSAILESAFDDYGGFAAAIVERYGPNGLFWQFYSATPYHPVGQIEIWNEENWAPYWCPGPDPEAFAGLAAAGASAVHAMKPSVEVILGGLVTLRETQRNLLGGVKGMRTDEFLNRMVAARPELPGLYDTVGVHLYGLTPAENLATLDWMRTVTNQAGFRNSKLAITEFGWNQLDFGGRQLDFGGSRERIADNYMKFVAELGEGAGCQLSGIAAHSWFTDQLNPLDPEHWWGMADPQTGQPYAGANAYAAAIGAARAPATEACSGSRQPELTTAEDSIGTIDLKGPKKKTRDRTPTFKFTLGPDLAAKCKIDKAKWKSCSSPYTAKRLAKGKHKLSIRAIDIDGVGTGDIESFKFRVV